MHAMKTMQHRQEIARGEFVSRDRKLSLVQHPQFLQGVAGFLAHVEQLFRIGNQSAPSIGERPVARRAVKEFLPQAVLKF